MLYIVQPVVLFETGGVSVLRSEVKNGCSCMGRAFMMKGFVDENALMYFPPHM